MNYLYDFSFNYQRSIFKWVRALHYSELSAIFFITSIPILLLILSKHEKRRTIINRNKMIENIKIANFYAKNNSIT